MKGSAITAVKWPKTAPFNSLCDALRLASASSEVIWIVREDLNVATLRDEVEENVVSSFRQDPHLSLIYGNDLNFVFVDKESLLTYLDLLCSYPPPSIRDLIKFFRESKFCAGLCKVKRLPISSGLMIGSPSFNVAIDRKRFQERRHKHSQLSAIIDELASEDPKKAENILRELGAAVEREVHSSDDIEWQLEWIRRRLSEDRC